MKDENRELIQQTIAKIIIAEGWEGAVLTEFRLDGDNLLSGALTITRQASTDKEKQELLMQANISSLEQSLKTLSQWFTKEGIVDMVFKVLDHGEGSNEVH